MTKIKEVDRWRSEILLAEDFREKEFGTYSEKKVSKAGENIDYYERGFTTGWVDYEQDDTASTLNIFHALVKNIVPALYYQNPKILAFPKRKVDEDTAPYASEILNYFYKAIEADKNNRKVIFDAYLLGIGVYKIGYATQFGMDFSDEETKKKSQKDRILEAVGLKKPEDKSPVRPEVNKEILAESPYVQWISPFQFLIDPRASSLDDAMWVAHVVEKTVEEIKKNPKFKNTAGIMGTTPDSHTDTNWPIPASHIEAFRTVKLYEIHYRNNNKYYLLYIVKDGTQESPTFKELYHEESIYDMDEWQFGILNFSGHTHKLYTRSDMTKIKNLQDRFTSTMDSVLAQVDAFVPKLIVDETAMSTASKEVLEDGDIGAIVYVNKSPRDVVQEASLTQYKADLAALNSEIINIITIQTGITKAQLLGIAGNQTATAETIAQGGQTLRLNDMTSEVQKVMNKQVEKLWKVIRQFVDLPTLELITGESGIDPQTGNVRYKWLPEINEDVNQKLQTGMYMFDTEVGSTQKADTPAILKRVENLLNILARTDVIALMQQQGKKVDLAELLRIMIRQMPEVVKDVGRIIQDIGPQTQGVLPPEIAQAAMGVQQGGTTAGSDLNQRRAMRAEPGTMESASQI